jgi:hypothetical protein
VKRNHSGCRYSRPVGRRGRGWVRECTIVGVDFGIAECPLLLAEERRECPVAKTWEDPRSWRPGSVPGRPPLVPWPIPR